MTPTMTRCERLASLAALGGGLVIVLAGCANGTALSAGQAASDSGSDGTGFSVSASTITTFGSGSVGAATSLRPSRTAPAPSTVNGSANGSSVLYLTAADSGRTITVRVGTRLELSLAPNGGSYDPPTIDGPMVLREDSHAGGFPGGSPAIARLTAVAPGLARISSTTDLACLHTSPACLPPQQEFILTVRVR